MYKTVIASALLATSAVLPNVALAADPAPEHAFTSNVTLASEYIYRGIGQTNRKPALQGGFDYAHASGFYAGIWGSNVSWLSDGSATGAKISNSLELDFYGGFKNTVGDFGYDVGLLQYYYPGTYPSGFNSPNTLEGYAAVSYSILTLKYSHSFTDLFGWVDSKNSGYLDLTATYELMPGLNVVGHVGRQKVNGDASGGASYTDYKLGVTKDFSGTVVGLSYVATNASEAWYTNAFNKDLGKDRFVLSVTRSF
ncbi:TorF family putative porin [Zoogloea sp.]|uniref:TorF family putative porin n=1 Tax=Zoogloea sp. TaxID=49181 RepID=UPI002615C024|nr:TorF family putative porin [Zoogloea sp.]MDD3354661.1 TorF family putative porin [Zoogloea sp.]